MFIDILNKLIAYCQNINVILDQLDILDHQCHFNKLVYQYYNL